MLWLRGPPCRGHPGSFARQLTVPRCSIHPKFPQIFGIFVKVPRAPVTASYFYTLRPRILADTNRDGFVNDSDATDKWQWTRQRGAIFLPNIGDRYKRCPTVDVNHQPLSNRELASFNDASGDVLLTPEYAASIRTVPLEGLTADAVGAIYTEPASTLGRVRIFWHQGEDANDPEQWTLVDRQMSFDATSLSQGLKLAIDSREVITDSSIWDGSVNVIFEVSDRNETAVDHVAMKQAPVLIHHHLQRPDVVLSADGATSPYPWQTSFVKSLKESLEKLPSKLPLVLFKDGDDIWAQDFLEPGYASMPGPNGPISIRVLLRSAQSTRDSGRQLFEQLRGPGVGVFQPGLGSGFGHEEINSGGNIETIPPYVSRSGVPYKSGRVIMGKHFDKYPAESMVTFLRSQGVQSPLILETGWLAIGHVDEMVQFLPYGNELGFTIAIADTTAALNILKNAKEKGHGSARVISYDGDTTPDAETFFLDQSVLNTTIDKFLSDKNLLDVNQYAQRHIESNLELLLDEVPLAREDVLRIPVLWQDVAFTWPQVPDGNPPLLHQPPSGERTVKTFFPGAINGLVLGTEYVAPKPWGPVVDGKDIMEEAIANVYSKASMKVRFIDDYMSHHVRGGEVHCGTNTLRDMSMAWWK
ncbi:Fc.00g114440.m01.CDS01 [Cosmosporella sp. VM-42]